MKKIREPRLIDKIIEAHGDELAVHERMVKCLICNIKIRHDADTVKRHINSNKHVRIKRLINVESPD